MPLQRFSSLRNATNGVLEGKIGKNFFWRVGGYCNGVQPPLSEIPGSAPVNGYSGIALTEKRDTN